MEGREDLKSILPFLPLIWSSSSLRWPPKALEALKALALGPDVSRVHSGEVLFDAIFDLRGALSLSPHALASSAADGYALFFDDLMPRAQSRMWFGEIVPYLARLLLRLPSLLEEHYMKSDEVFGEGKAGLRILGQQDAGIVFLSQELIATLLACAFLCLFPTKSRGSSNLPIINFDQLFAVLHSSGAQRQEEKIKCIVHYFERLCLSMPTGYVSFERKVLPYGNLSSDIAYPDVASWEESTSPLCSFQVSVSGFIEDQPHEALEVDFANKYLGGGALRRGCVQEEIRFMINPELIAGMLFMPSMEDNEAIEIVGVERFSNYTGYGSSFQFVGDYLDNKQFDSIGRRKTSVLAIDAFSSPGMRQYKVEFLIREINKAFCGFVVSRKHQCCSKTDETSSEPVMSSKNSEIGVTNNHRSVMNSYSKHSEVSISQENAGIATGNWGCGAFGGDPEIKSIIQWLAASQASRPFIHYYTFGESSLNRLEEVTWWILQHGWTVGDLWSMLLQYCSQRLDRETEVGFLNWLVPYPDIGKSNNDYMSE